MFLIALKNCKEYFLVSVKKINQCIFWFRKKMLEMYFFWFQEELLSVFLAEKNYLSVFLGEKKLL